MPKEIERKFLVAGDGWQEKADRGTRFTQAYLLGSDDRSLRVRISDNVSARLTMKFGRGLSRDEFEYAIPLDDARELVTHALGTVIDKTRYRISEGGFVWEVDVFHGAHEGLVIAEVELASESDNPTLPDWLGLEVTGKRQYTNQALAAAGSWQSEEC